MHIHSQYCSLRTEGAADILTDPNVEVCSRGEGAHEQYRQLVHIFVQGLSEAIGKISNSVTFRDIYLLLL